MLRPGFLPSRGRAIRESRVRVSLAAWEDLSRSCTLSLSPLCVFVYMGVCEP